MPTTTTSEPMMAAREYAGAVEARPMTSESTKPIAFGFSVAVSLGLHGRPLDRRHASFTATCLTRVYSSIE